MRVVSFGERGREQAGVLGAKGTRVIPVAALDPALPTTVRALIAGQHLPRIAALLTCSDESGVALADVRLGPPIPDPGKVVCIGLYFKGHAAEQNKPWP